MLKRLLPSLSILLLSSCGYTPSSIDIKPRQEPAYNFTQSSQVLACLGRQIDQTTVTPIDVFVSEIPDHTTSTIETGFLTKNSVMMVTTALDRLHTDKVAIIGRNGAMRNRRQVQILGAFTELNRTVKSNAISGQAALPGGFEVELGGDRNYNHIALDIAMSERNRLIPGTATSISVQLAGNSGDVTLTYDEGDDFAAIGALGYTGQEGFNSAQRLLIETSVALMVSKYFQVDIKSCLGKNKKDVAPEIPGRYDEPVFIKPEASKEDINAQDVEPIYEPVPLRRSRTVPLQQGADQGYSQREDNFFGGKTDAVKSKEDFVVLPRSRGRRIVTPQSIEKPEAPDDVLWSSEGF